MKKIFFILISVFVFSIVILGGLFISCDLITNKEDSLITESGKIKNPSVKSNENGKGVIITVYNIDNVKYVNLYRQDVTNKSNPGKEINIGILYPEYYGKHGWIYEDSYVYADHTYKYRVKYTTTKGIYNSNWSETFTVKGNKGYDVSKAKFKYTVSSSAYFEFDKENYTLTLCDGSFLISSIPKEIVATGINPKIVFSNGKTKKAYKFPDINKETYDIEEGSVLWLRNVLEPDFTDTYISIEAIIFESVLYADNKDGEIVNDEERPIKCIIWGEPTDILPRAPKKFEVKSTTVEAGYDYSD